mgnify:CR=1 FL=1
MKNEAALAKKNIEIGLEFSRLLLANPELGEKIPEDAMGLFEVADDPKLTAYNRTLAKRNKDAGQPLVVVRIKGLAATRLLRPTVARVVA